MFFRKSSGSIRGGTVDQQGALPDPKSTLFEHLQITPFVPHITFLYGSIPTFKKETIIKDLGDEFWLDFTMRSLRLVSTQRTPENWSLIEEIEL